MLLYSAVSRPQLQEPEAVAAIFIILNTLLLIAETISILFSLVNTNA
jgi:hypothetical protein